MSDLVIDASAVIDLLVEGLRTSALESHIVGATLVAPDLVGLEVLSAFGRLPRAGRLAPPDVERGSSVTRCGSPTATTSRVPSCSTPPC